jgi:hypothetical protein
MPHLMNCPHKAGSHCLDCVKAEWERREAETSALRAALDECVGALKEFATSKPSTVPLWIRRQAQEALATAAKVADKESK